MIQRYIIGNTEESTRFLHAHTRHIRAVIAYAVHVKTTHIHAAHTYVMHAHVMHSHAMHSHALHGKFYVIINSDMLTAAIVPKPVF
jgi:hypothetical protein